MTEQEYINLTNLTKYRAMRQILRDVLPISEGEREEVASMHKELERIEGELIKRVNVD